ncbi:MAG: hypothetical protein IJ191_04500 [Treponema sp.]|nr:hypothetical protein [Treponema sp.]
MSEPSVRAAEHLMLDYHFSARELSALARFLRSKAAELPESLDDFSRAVETAVYDALSITEAEQFFA